MRGLALQQEKNCVPQFQKFANAHLHISFWKTKNEIFAIRKKMAKIRWVPHRNSLSCLSAHSWSYSNCGTQFLTPRMRCPLQVIWRYIKPSFVRFKLTCVSGHSLISDFLNLTLAASVLISEIYFLVSSFLFCPCSWGPVPQTPLVMLSLING